MRRSAGSSARTSGGGAPLALRPGRLGVSTPLFHPRAPPPATPPGPAPSRRRAPPPSRFPSARSAGTPDEIDPSPQRTLSQRDCDGRVEARQGVPRGGGGAGISSGISESARPVDGDDGCGARGAPRRAFRPLERGVASRASRRRRGGDGTAARPAGATRRGRSTAAVRSDIFFPRAARSTSTLGRRRPTPARGSRAVPATRLPRRVVAAPAGPWRPR